MSANPIPVVDLFAGPGGLGEGFSRVDDGKAFQTIISIEKDPHAIETLRLRAFYRAWMRSHRKVPPAYLDILASENLEAKQAEHGVRPLLVSVRDKKRLKDASLGAPSGKERPDPIRFPSL